MVEGSHSWLLADPQQFGEIITNDVKVAQAARELELDAPTGKRKGLRRVPSLARRPNPDPSAWPPARVPGGQPECPVCIRVGTRTPGCEYPLG